MRWYPDKYPNDENVQTFNTLTARTMKLIRGEKRETYNAVITNMKKYSKITNSPGFYKEIEILLTWRKYFKTLLNVAVTACKTCRKYQTAEEYIHRRTIAERCQMSNQLTQE